MTQCELQSAQYNRNYLAHHDVDRYIYSIAKYVGYISLLACCFWCDRHESI